MKKKRYTIKQVLKAITKDGGIVINKCEPIYIRKRTIKINKLFFYPLVERLERILDR